MKRLISLLAALACLLGAFVAPSASAAATYNIKDVGDASWVGVTDTNGRELSGQTTASNGLQVTATVRLRIDDIGALREGDTVLVKATAASGSHFGPDLFSIQLPGQPGAGMHFQSSYRLRFSGFQTSTCRGNLESVPSFGLSSGAYPQIRGRVLRLQFLDHLRPTLPMHYGRVWDQGQDHRASWSRLQGSERSGLH